jgi:hypothetical protein
VGYHTEFTGHVAVTPPLNEHEVNYLRKFANSRRYARTSGPYQTETDSYRGPDTVDYNDRADGQPGLWCDWEPSDDGTRISWNGTEKFYYADVWMRYLIDTFLRPDAALQGELAEPRLGRYYAPEFGRFTFDHIVDGAIEAYGDDPSDVWTLRVVGNEVETVEREPSANDLVMSDAVRDAVETLRSAGVTTEMFERMLGLV